jgi:hypothetical protein
MTTTTEHPLDTATDRPDAVAGTWRAVLADDHGFVVSLGELENGDECSVRVVRRSDMPTGPHDDERLPGTRVTGELDTLYEHEDLVVGDDDVAGRWAQAQTVARLLNDQARHTHN